MDKFCIACGMPMKNNLDFAKGDSNKDYCKFCCRENGDMQSYDEKLESMARFIQKMKNIDISAAKAIAKDNMAKLPAWLNIKNEKESDIEIIEKELVNTLEIQAKASICMMPFVIGKAYKSIIEYLKQSKIECAGAPYVRYLNVKWDELDNVNKLFIFIRMCIRRWDMLIGFPIKATALGKGDIRSGVIAKGKYIQATHIGPYQNLGMTYKKIKAWICEKKINIKSECIEIYLNDPRTDKKENLKTIILIPVNI